VLLDQEESHSHSRDWDNLHWILGDELDNRHLTFHSTRAPLHREHGPQSTEDVHEQEASIDSSIQKKYNLTSVMG